MEELIDLIATDESPSTISSRIKELLYNKAADRVDDARPYVAASMFGDDSESEEDDEFETEDEDEDYSEDQE